MRLDTTLKFEQYLNHEEICITGTDTGIGKTVVTGLLAKKLAETKKVVTQKWVQSGDLDNPDIKTHDKLSGLSISSEFIKDRQVYSFKTPASPHLAASIENTCIQPQKLVQATHRLKAAFDTVLIETSGGVMVPLSESMTIGDVIASISLPTIIVVPNKLGTINHTLLTAHYLKTNNIPLVGFILNNFEPSSDAISRDNPKIISKLMNMPHIATVNN